MPIDLFDDDGNRVDPGEDAPEIHRAAYALDKMFKENPGDVVNVGPWFERNGIKPGCFQEELSFYMANIMDMVGGGVPIEAALATAWATAFQVGYDTRKLQTSVLGIRRPW